MLENTFLPGIKTTLIKRTLVISLDNPVRANALSYVMLESLEKALKEVPGSIAGIVLTGVAANFSAGADFADITGTAVDEEFDDAVDRVVSQILASEVPIVAAIEGACVGAAAHIALSCDIRFAGGNSFIAVPAVKLGLLYNPSAVELLATKYRADVLQRLLVLGEKFTATEAVQAGLFSKVVAAGDAVNAAAEILEQVELVALPAMKATKKLLQSIATNAFDGEYWQGVRREFLTSQQRAEAVKQAHTKHKE